MLSFIKFPNGKHMCVNSNDSCKVVCFHEIVPFPDEDYYFVCCGKRVVNSEPITDGHTYHVVPRLHGGKGGFGSMLRAIGAQIEKTTSREACRDLSGRRMRDVNNEKKLREWVASKAEREREREERRRQRMERRRAVPKHCFNNPDFEEQKRTVVENLDDALEQGLKQAGISRESRKRRSAEAASGSAKKCRPSGGMGSDEMSDLELGSDYSDSDQSDSSSPPQPGSSSLSQSREPAVVNMCSEVDVASLVPNHGMPERTVQQESLAGEPSRVSVGEVASPGSIAEVANGIMSAVSRDATAVWKDDGEPIETAAVVPAPANEETANEAASTAVKVEATVKYMGPVELELLQYDCAEQLEALGLEVLKAALISRGLKCGGALKERATRLYSVKGLSDDQIKPSLFSKGGKVKGKARN